jgi:hypothetical protein
VRWLPADNVRWVGAMMCSLLFANGCLSGNSARECRLRIHAEPVGSRYVVGTEVELRVTVTNIGLDRVLVPVSEMVQLFRFEIAWEDEETFRLQHWDHPQVTLRPRNKLLAPDESEIYVLKVYFGGDACGSEPRIRETSPRSPLVFARPGLYRIRMHFPHPESGPGRWTYVESNVAQVRILAPQGNDATVWREIECDRPFLEFMRWGVPSGTPSQIAEQVRRAMRIVHADVHSGYREQLMRSLQVFRDDYVGDAGSRNVELDSLRAEIDKLVAGKGN